MPGEIVQPSGRVQDQPTQDVGRDDPSSDGWDTEAFHLQVQAQLKSLGKLLTQKAEQATRGNLDSKHQAEIFEENCQSTDLVTDSLSKFYQRDGLTIERRDADVPLITNQAPENALLNLISEYQPGQNIRVEFKVFSVDTKTDFPVTKQFVSMFGRTDSGVTEYFAVWNIEWYQPARDQQPLIRNLSLESLQRSNYSRSSSSQPMLVDLTEQVFGDNPAFHSQHGFGLNHWSATIETDLNRDLMGHQGIAIGDIDGDRLDDFYISQTGGIPNRLYLNTGDGKVNDISAGSGVEFLDHTTGALFADFDNDGDQDLVVGMYHGTAILTNDGAGRFRQACFLEQAKHIYSPTVVDYDLDGDLDLYLCAYYSDGSNAQEFPYPYPFDDATNGGRNFFFRNDGDFQFSDVTEESGLNENNSRYSYSAGWEDFDGDGDLDLYVANDFGSNNLYVNENGTFTDQTVAKKAEDGNFGMSVTWGDVNLDGWPDLYISNMFSGAGNRIVPQAGFNPDLDEKGRANFLKLARGNSLLKNMDGQSFEDVSLDAGVNLGRWAWASTFADMNNDGFEDILVGNGYITGEDSGDL